MVWSLTVHDTPEENSVSERLKCTLLEHACAMIIASCLPKFLWTEAIQHTVWLKNHTATHALDSKTPFEVLFKQKPNLQDLPEWGTHVVVLHEGRGKLDKKANEGRWVGYSGDSQGHRIYWPGKCHITVERNVNLGMAVQPDGMAEGQKTPTSSDHAHVEPSPD